MAQKSNFIDIVSIALVALMSIGANLPGSVDINIDRRYLMAGLVGIVAVALIRYLKFTFILMISILIVGANLPAQLAAELGVDRSIMMFALVAMVIVSLSNQLFKLPTGVDTSRRSTTTSKTHGASALYSAISKGRLPTVKALLEQGVSANIRTTDGQTPLIFAASKGYGDVVQLLLATGADATAKNNDGKTAMKIAKDMGYTRVVEMLEGAGAME